MRERLTWDSQNHPTSLVDMVHVGWVQRLLLADQGRGFPGPGPGDAAAKAQRIIEKLAELDITYVHEPSESTSTTQQVRPLDEVLSLRQATCLDLCVTFCSAALDAGIHPLILVVEQNGGRHALVLVPHDRTWMKGCSALIEGGVSRTPLVTDGTPIQEDVSERPDDPRASWLAIDVLQACSGTGPGAGLWENAVAEGARYVREWAWDVCVDIGGLRSTRPETAPPRLVSVDRVLAPAYHPLPAHPTPLQLVQTRYGVVPFAYRPELDELQSWAVTRPAAPGPDLAVAVVTGAGGTGKTRLTAEFCARLSPIGWYAGFLPSTARLTDDELGVLAELTTELLVVVDYAEESRKDQLSRVLRGLRGRRSPTRVVLTARGTDVWWDQFQEELIADDIPLQPPKSIRALDKHPHPELLYRRAARRFAEKQGQSTPTSIPPDLGATPLDVVLRAWIAVAEENSEETIGREDLYERVLATEFARWRKFPALAEISTDRLRRAAATLSLLAPRQDDEVVDTVLARLPEWAPEHLRRSRVAEPCSALMTAKAYGSSRTRSPTTSFALFSNGNPPC
ncbi:MAG: hypothetical protein Q4G45_07190 [Actinomycetia bacterium]|nr:hypothetical protein [Actinomycetes bacterium]